MAISPSKLVPEDVRVLGEVRVSSLRPRRPFGFVQRDEGARRAAAAPCPGGGGAGREPGQSSGGRPAEEKGRTGLAGAPRGAPPDDGERADHPERVRHGKMAVPVAASSAELLNSEQRNRVRRRLKMNITRWEPILK